MKRSLNVCLLCTVAMVLASCGGGQSSDTGSKSDPSDRYQVSEAYWTSNITQFGLFGKNNNITLTLKATVNGAISTSGAAENANGKVHLTLDEGEQEFDVYVDTLDDGSYDYYIKNGLVSWEKTHLTATYAQRVMATFTNFIHPWAFSDFSYDAESHSYKKTSDQMIVFAGEIAQVSNIVFAFEDGKFMSLNYDATASGRSGHMTVTASKWGSTSVTLPEATSSSSSESSKESSSDVSESTSEKSSESSSEKTSESSSEKTSESSSESSSEQSSQQSDSSNSSQEAHSDSPFVGVTLKYKAGSASEMAYGYTDPTFNAEKLETHMATITISMFDDGTTPNEKEEGSAVENATFELVSMNSAGRINYAYVGVYEAEEDVPYNQITLTAYYNGETAKWYHGDHMNNPKQLVFDINGGFEYDAQTNLYSMGTYLKGVDGVVAKGNFFFEKVNDKPVHASLPEDPHDDNYEEVLQNKVYRYDGVATPSSSNPTKPCEDAYRTSYIAIFEDNYLEYYCDYQIGATIQETQLLWRGYYEVTDATDNVWTIAYYPYEVVKDGEVISITGTAFTFSYNVGNAILTYTQNVGKDLKCTVAWKLSSGETPVPFVPTLPDNWNAKAVADAFTTIGVEGGLPKYDNAKTFDLKMSGTAGFTITMVVLGGTSAYNDYLMDLTENHGFTKEIMEDYSIYYLSANAQFELTTNYATDTNTVTLTVKKHTIYFPAKEIAQYLSDRSYTDTIIDLQIDGAIGYEFEEDGDFTAYFSTKKAAEEAVKAYILRATAAGYTKEVFFEKDAYVSPNQEYAIFILAEGNADDGYFAYVAIYSYDVLLRYVYPTKKIAAILEGVTDAYIEFSSEGAKYYEVNDPVLYFPFPGLYVHLDEGNALAESFVEGLKKLGYNYATQMTLTSMGINGEPITKTYNLSQGYWVSPNNQVAFSIFGANPTEYGGGYVSIDIFNLTKCTDITIEGEHWTNPLQNLEVIDIIFSDYTSTYYVGDTFVYDGVITAVFSDNSTKALEEGDYTVKQMPDMSKPGQTRFVITYTYNDSTKTQGVKITVLEKASAATLTGIQITGATQTYTVGDEFAFDGTVIATYSDESTKVLPADAYTISGTVNMDEAATYIITVSYTENGVTKTANLMIVVAAAVVQKKTIRMINDDSVNIFEANACFKIWAWGGEYGEGAWVDVQVTEATKSFVFDLYVNCAGFKIVRLNPDYNIADETWTWNQTTVWGETGDMTIASVSSSSGGVATFHFYNAE